jgi:hypothetical protein
VLSIPIIRFEPIVWISITHRDHNAKQLAGDSVRVPAIFDTGCSLSSLVHRWHLESWFGIIPEVTRSSKFWNVFNQKVASIPLDIWLHYSFDSDAGIAVKMRYSEGVGVGQIRVNADSTTESEPKNTEPSEKYAEMLRNLMAAVSTKQSPTRKGFKASEIPKFIHPRLPLLGMPFLVENQLSLEVNSSEVQLTKLVDDSTKEVSESTLANH